VRILKYPPAGLSQSSVLADLNAQLTKYTGAMDAGSIVTTL